MNKPRFKKSIIGALCVSLLVLGMPGLATKTAMAQTQQDSDEDGVSDSEDNCPNTYNPEQFDLDGDHRGDECDVTLVRYGLSSEYPNRVMVDIAPSEDSREYLFGTIYNMTQKPVTVRMRSHKSFIDVEPYIVVKPGQARDLKAMVIASNLPNVAGAITGFVEVIFDDLGEIISSFFETIVDRITDLVPCAFRVYMWETRATEGQGGLEGKLEARITGYASGAPLPNSLAPWPLPPASKKLNVGGPWRDMLVPLSIVTVPKNEPKTITISTSVVEVDFPDADDYGGADGTMTLECGKGPYYKTLTVDLYRPNKNDWKGQIQVKFFAEQI